MLELFHLARRASFQRFAELIFSESGAFFEATRFARPCEVSRQTIMNYLAVLESTFGGTAEIVSARGSARSTPGSSASTGDGGSCDARI